MMGVNETAAGLYRLIVEHGADNAFSIQEITDKARHDSRHITRLIIGRACASQLSDVQGQLRRIAPRRYNLSREIQNGITYVRVTKLLETKG
jgi:hypothetical protein